MFSTIFCWLQYINPTVKNSQHPLKGNYLYALERILKLSIPTLYVWLCMFYCFFHLWYVNKQSFSLLSVLSKCRTKIHPWNWLNFLACLCTLAFLCPWGEICRLNIVAEVLRFGDREFYKDWWNAKTVEEVKGVHFLAFSSWEFWPFIKYEELDG